MTCKNCNTPAADGDKFCQNCGSTLEVNTLDSNSHDDMVNDDIPNNDVFEDNTNHTGNNHNNHNNNGGKWKFITLAGLALALVLTFVYTGRNRQAANEVPPEPPSESTVTDNQTEQPGETVKEEDEPRTSSEVAEPSELPSPSIQPEAPIPTSEADLDMEMADVWAMIDEVVVSVNTLYDKYSPTVAYLSKNGYLYDNPASDYVFLDELEGLTDLDSKYMDESVLFFYLRPSDLAGFGDLRVSESEELKIFAGYETKDGFAISGQKEQGGIISRKDLQQVLDSYSWDHGSIRKIPFQTDEFERIIKAITEYDGNTSGYDVRYMYRDDKYISVVASPKDDPTALGQYILEDTGDIFIVRLADIESFSDYRQQINKKLPDFNQKLLPEYNLNTNLKYLRTDFNNVVDAMKQGKLIAEEDVQHFSSGTEDFAYLEFDSGNRFVGMLENNNSWKMYPVEDYETALLLMDSLSPGSPDFILKQY